MQYSISVSEVNKYIKEIISRDLVLSNLWVKGEISNYKHHYSGHMYFTLKDERSLIKCVMFKSHAASIGFVPENGMKVIIKGYVSVFERDGQYQLYAEAMQPDGIGSLHVAFEQLKKRLQDEGLFEQARKRKLPLIPVSIGVVTSSTGSVIRDIINVLSRRYPNFNLKLYPVQVQGEAAAPQIAEAIRKLNELECVDVIIAARGGGSLEELWAFNEEIVARSIFESKIPVISAVGHETDYTIADFVADVRAPTPSAAAELVVPEKSQIYSRLINMDRQMRNSFIKLIKEKRMRHEKLAASVAFRQPFNRVYQERMRLDVLNKYLGKTFKAQIERLRAKMANAAGRLDALSPLSVLARGYGIIKSENDGSIVKSVTDVRMGEKLEISVCDGIIDCIVERATGGGTDEKGKEKL